MGKIKSFALPFGDAVNAISTALSMGPAFMPKEKLAELQAINQSFRETFQRLGRLQYIIHGWNKMDEYVELLVDKGHKYSYYSTLIYIVHSFYVDLLLRNETNRQKKYDDLLNECKKENTQYAFMKIFSVMDPDNFENFFDKYDVNENDSLAFSTVLSGFAFESLTSAEMLMVCNNIRGKYASGLTGIVQKYAQFVQCLQSSYFI